jgi:hypothetical protein
MVLGDWPWWNGGYEEGGTYSTRLDSPGSVAGFGAAMTEVAARAIMMVEMWNCILDMWK